jgi:hypothetical protein
MSFIIPKYHKGGIVYVDDKDGLSEIKIMEIAFDARSLLNHLFCQRSSIGRATVL